MEPWNLGSLLVGCETGQPLWERWTLSALNVGYKLIPNSARLTCLWPQAGTGTIKIKAVIV